MSRILRGKSKTLKSPGVFLKKKFSTILGNWDGRELGLSKKKKKFGSGADAPPMPEETQSKAENNWESTNNLKLWQLNISRDFLLCKIIATYVVDS